MTTEDAFILFGPFLVYVLGMALAFGFHHYKTNKQG